MVFAGIKLPDTTLVRDAVELSRSSLEPILFNHGMRSWLFGVLLSEGAEHAPDAELLAVAATLHDLGLSERSARISERSWHLGTADAACVGCHRTSHDPHACASQRA
jgi:hypothetical protein